MKPLNERSIVELEEQKRQLQNTYTVCSAIFWSLRVTSELEKALVPINDAINDIENNIRARSGK